jgi:uncharacterized protein (TIGR02246 family)
MASASDRLPDGTDAAIAALYTAWNEAIRQRDVDAVMNMLTPDYELWAPGAPPMSREDLAPRLRAALETYEITPSFEREEQIVSGDLAFERGWDVQEARPRGGGETRVQRSRVFLVLRRGQDGQWRFARGMTQAGPQN